MQDRAPAAGSFTTVAAPAARGPAARSFPGRCHRHAVALARQDADRAGPCAPRRPGAQRTGRAGAAWRHLRARPAAARARHAAAAGHPLPHPLRGRRPDRARQARRSRRAPAPGNQDGTLVNALLAHCGEQLTGIGGERRPGIVHRLDKDTSGVMVVAKTQLANTALTAAFAARDLDRAYLALVWGLPNPLAGDIEGAIGRDPRDRKRMAVVDPQRQGRAHPLPHAARLADRGRPAGMPARHRADAPDPRAPRQPRPPGGRRSALPAPRPGRRPHAARAGPPQAAGLPPPGAARGPARLRPPAHRRSHSASPPTRRPTWPA